MKLWFCAVIAASLTIYATTTTAWAATKISKVKVEIQLEDADGELEVNAEAGSDKYDIVNIKFEGELFSYATGPGKQEHDDIKETQKTQENIKCEIELSAVDEYYFDTMQQKDIKISGIEGACTKAVRKDNAATLILTIDLTGLDNFVGNISDASFAGTSGEWESAANAATYSLALYKDSKKRGLLHETSATRYDFSALMTESGVYFYKVFSLSSGGKKGRATESNYASVTEEQARDNRERAVEALAGWQQADTKWRYLYSDLVPVQNNWILDGTDWYFFDDNGYMVTNTWQLWKNKWYQFDSDGKLIQ